MAINIGTTGLGNNSLSGLPFALYTIVLYSGKNDSVLAFLTIFFKARQTFDSPFHNSWLCDFNKLINILKSYIHQVWNGNKITVIRMRRDHIMKALFKQWNLHRHQLEINTKFMPVLMSISVVLRKILKDCYGLFLVLLRLFEIKARYSLFLI